MAGEGGTRIALLPSLSDSTSPALSPFAARVEAYARAEAARQNDFTAAWTSFARTAELALSPLDREMARAARQHAAATAIRTADDRSMGWVAL